jgi:RNase P/RNase MRP subunit POP5
MAILLLNRKTVCLVGDVGFAVVNLGCLAEDFRGQTWVVEVVRGTVERASLPLLLHLHSQINFY